MGPKSDGSILIRDIQRRDPQRRRRCKDQREMWPEAKESPEPSEAGRGKEQNFPLSPQREHNTFWPPELGEKNYLLF